MDIYTCITWISLFVNGYLHMHYLDIIVGVPVGVVDDDGVGRGQVDTQTSRPRRQQETELLRTGG